MIRRRSSARGGVARERQGDGHDHGAPVDRDAPDHAELDDRAAQLGVLDRRERSLDVEHLGHSMLGTGHRGLLGISTSDR